jgi:hypothetical protein
MSGKHRDTLDKALHRLEEIHWAQRTQKAIFDILGVLYTNGHVPMSLTDIARELGKAMTPGFRKLVETMVLCGYLEHEYSETETLYAPRKHQPGKLPKPLLPLPYHYVVGDDRSN